MIFIEMRDEMRRWIPLCLLIQVLALGCMGIVAYGYWTDKLVAQVKFAVVYSAEIEMAEDEILDEIPVNPTATDSNAGEIK